MTGFSHLRRAMGLLAIGAMLLAMPGAAAAQGTPTAKAKAKGTPFAGFGGNSKEPIRVDANKLEVFDKENRGVYSGDVVAVQGQSTLRCATMTFYYTGGGATKKAGAVPSPAGDGNSIRKIECAGPVSVVSGTMSATSKFMVYDAEAETVTFTGNVVIADCDNVQRGERAIYDVKTGRATVDAGGKGRVQGIFTPGGDEKKKAPGECPQATN
jgi:lipopolysaccharide export system protein LptA